MFAIVVGVPLGVVAAYRRGSAVDVGSMVGANLGVSMPVFWLGLMLQFVFAQQLGWLPPSGRLPAGRDPRAVLREVRLERERGVRVPRQLRDVQRPRSPRSGSVFWESIRYLILPAIALGTIPLAVIARMTRSSLCDNLGLDYVRTARAKGLREFLVVRRHAMRNSLLPVVTVIGLSLGALVGGAVLTETIFNLTGVGKTVFDAISARDYAVVQGFTLVIAVAFVLVNLRHRHLVHVPRPPGDGCSERARSRPSSRRIPPVRRCRRRTRSARTVADDAARDAAQAVGGDRPRRPRSCSC